MLGEVAMARPFWLKPFWFKKVCSSPSLLQGVSSFVSTSDVNWTQRMTGHRGSMLVQCDPPTVGSFGRTQRVSVSRRAAMRCPSASSRSPQFSSSQGQWRQERSKVSPEVVLENARKQAMIASGTDESFAEVTEDSECHWRKRSGTHRRLLWKCR